MTEKQVESETAYRLARFVFSSLMEKEIITAEHWKLLLCAASEKYDSMIGKLETESIAIENGYKD